MSNGTGPCGACKFLRRKCVKGCIFAPYFDSEQGMAHFAVVHKVFGASNTSKLLLTIPPNKRFETVVTLYFEALARVRDPVYGCVGHIISLQQQAVTLQAELAYVQARISMLHHHHHHLPMPPPTPLQADLAAACCSNVSSSVCTSGDPLIDITDLCNVLDQQLDNSM
ncbi:LOB domain-containing protein 19 [Solanum lycopersicum]|uniref:LOB domain-containing protein n=1 Tax=Solanum lycopersicum TaxID=4081 RepID=A0A3Q7F4J3_SOLLC|nr:LOB domain-containing protein 19 [Solanum lycopersicum]